MEYHVHFYALIPHQYGPSVRSSVSLSMWTNAKPTKRRMTILLSMWRRFHGEIHQFCRAQSGQLPYPRSLSRSAHTPNLLHLDDGQCRIVGLSTRTRSKEYSRPESHS